MDQLINILLVDDEVDYIKTLSERLAIRGYENRVAHDGEGALQKIAQERPDIVILDLKMPGMNGMEVLRKINESPEKILVIIVSGHGTDREEEEAEQLGVHSFMKKPVDIDVLIENVQDAFQFLGTCPSWREKGND